MAKEIKVCAACDRDFKVNKDSHIIRCPICRQANNNYKYNYRTRRSDFIKKYNTYFDLNRINSTTGFFNLGLNKCSLELGTKIDNIQDYDKHIEHIRSIISRLQSDILKLKVLSHERNEEK